MLQVEIFATKQENLRQSPKTHCKHAENHWIRLPLQDTQNPRSHHNDS